MNLFKERKMDPLLRLPVDIETIISGRRASGDRGYGQRRGTGYFRSDSYEGIDGQ